LPYQNSVQCGSAVLSPIVEDSKCETSIDDLWFLLHHSEESDRILMGLTYYLDDSGSDDGSPMVTCGGLVMDQPNFKEFSKRWARMYTRNQFAGYTLEQPLHMSDFFNMGKYAGLYPEFKRALFRDVAKLINEHKRFSASVAISQRDFEKELAKDVRNNLIGPYAFAFFSIVLFNQLISTKSVQGPFKTAYLVDRGFGHQEQLNQAHDIVVRFEKALGGFRHTGALATDSDDEIPALQAADAISWASRKMKLDRKLPEGFEPLLELLHEDINPPHVTIPIPREGIRMLAGPINKWIFENGSMPKLTDIMARTIGGGVAVKLKS
jgi:hypothetical protein